MQRTTGFVFSALAFAAALAVPAMAQAKCQLSFSVNGAQSYPAASFSSFVDTEIRPRLTATPGTFQLAVGKACAGAAAQTLSITMDDTDYYLLAITGHQLSEVESRYQTSALMLSEANLEAKIDQALQIGSLQTAQIQDVTKTLAFFFAESARFADLEAAGATMINGACSTQWLTDASLVRHWSILSKFAIHKGLGGWTSKQGQLVAPVTHTVINAYNVAVAAGKQGPDAAFVASKDWGHPIQVGAVSCGAG